MNRYDYYTKVRDNKTFLEYVEEYCLEFGISPYTIPKEDMVELASEFYMDHDDAPEWEITERGDHEL